jgi:hypothetical protein
MTPSPAYLSYCFEDLVDTVDQVISYGDTYTTFALIGAPSWVSIDTSSGHIQFDPSSVDLPTDLLGSHTFVISASDGGDPVFFTFTIIVEPCYELNSDSVSFCTNDSPKTFQFGVEGETTTDYILLTTIPGLSLSSGGLLTYDSSLYINTDIEISYKIGDTTYTKTVHLYADACVIIEPQQTELCEEDLLQIVWRNAQGGNESFCFVYDKTFSVKQEKDIRYKNASREQRFLSRGEVWDYVEVINQMIPSAYVDKIRSLKDSIQAWVASNISNEETYIAIIIDPNEFIIHEVKAQYANLSFKFKYAKNKLIQRQ